jgi:hypothetical protein
VNNTSNVKSNSITRFRLFIFIAIFFLCALIGFISVQWLSPYFFHKNASTASTPAATIYINQGNFLLVHIDTSAPAPRLVSVWAIFISKNSPPSLIAKSLYPDSTETEKSRKIEQTFAYSEKNGLSADFLNAIQSYDWQWNAYMVVDNEGINQLSRWINNSASIQFADSSSSSQSVLDSERELLLLTCKNLTLSDTERGEKPHWQKLIPTHLQTDLFFKDAAVNWDRITFSNPAPDCKALIAP